MALVMILLQIIGQDYYDSLLVSSVFMWQLDHYYDGVKTVVEN
jgi:hypothetical protein